MNIPAKVEEVTFMVLKSAGLALGVVCGLLVVLFIILLLNEIVKAANGGDAGAILFIIGIVAFCGFMSYFLFFQ
jgi:hypothetical protein